MKDPDRAYELLVRRSNLDDFADYRALRLIGLLVDLSASMQKKGGLEHAIALSEQFQRRELAADQLATTHYFISNAWSGLRKVAGKDEGDWEQPELERQILHLRIALRTASTTKGMSHYRLCQILTNLGIAMSAIGRPAEAIEYWDRALKRYPRFSMARGSRGYGLCYYANSLHDVDHTDVMLKFAHADLTEAVSPRGRPFLEGATHALAFEEMKAGIEASLTKEYLHDASDLEPFSLGDTDEEIDYRRWCLDNRLFINPLNDLGPQPMGTSDVLMLPRIVTNHKQGPSGPSILGLYNQLKQEFVSARHLYFEGTRPQYTHFSDRSVYLYDTFDYPAYSLAVEKTKVAFRMTYSILDKIAFFLNHYLGLGIRDTRTSFRTIWYTNQEKREGLASEFQRLQNWPLRGLFWVSKDFFEDKPGFQEALEPDAQELKQIRNALEHRYLKLHEMWWPGTDDDYGGVSSDAIAALKDSLAVALYVEEFETKALRLLKLTRAALIYLNLAVHWEESRRTQERNPKQEIPSMEAPTFEDERKIR